jgi:hypothetical protein
VKLASFPTPNSRIRLLLHDLSNVDDPTRRLLLRQHSAPRGTTTEPPNHATVWKDAIAEFQVFLRSNITRFTQKLCSCVQNIGISIDNAYHSDVTEHAR